MIKNIIIDYNYKDIDIFLKVLLHYLNFLSLLTIFKYCFFYDE